MGKDYFYDSETDIGLASRKLISAASFPDAVPPHAQMSRMAVHHLTETGRGNYAVDATRGRSFFYDTLEELQNKLAAVPAASNAASASKASESAADDEQRV